jgi:sirohydrochlorin ferrochelatase
MQVVIWLSVGILGALTGVSLVRYLVVHPLRADRYLVATLVALGATGVVITIGLEGTLRLVGAALGLVAAVGGYAWATRQVLAREDSRPVPLLTRDLNDPGLGHTAVVYFTHGEPETYDPIGWINQFNEFDEQGIAFVPLLVRPLFLYRLRQSYLAVGKSDHRGMHMRMLASLEAAYRAQGDTETRFYLSFLDDNPRPDAAVIEALNDGASRIVVAEVFLTISNHTTEGKELIEALELDGRIPIHYTGPLWDSEALRRAFLDKADAHLGDADRSRVGVLLVGHGQPDEWDREWATETEQETRFREEVLDLFERDGYRRENLSQAWMEFKEPKPAAAVEAFSENGVETVLYYSAAISADAMHSQRDVPALVSQARVRDGLELVNLGAWNDHPRVIQAIREKIDAQLASLGSVL